MSELARAAKAYADAVQDVEAATSHQKIQQERLLQANNTLENARRMLEATERVLRRLATPEVIAKGALARGTKK